MESFILEVGIFFCNTPAEDTITAKEQSQVDGWSTTFCLIIYLSPLRGGRGAQ